MKTIIKDYVPQIYKLNIKVIRVFEFVNNSSKPFQFVSIIDNERQAYEEAKQYIYDVVFNIMKERCTQYHPKLKHTIKVVSSEKIEAKHYEGEV